MILPLTRNRINYTKISSNENQKIKNKNAGSIRPIQTRKRIYPYKPEKIHQR